MWYLKIDEIKELIEDSVDDYGHHIAAGFRVIKGRYLEQASEESNRISYHIMKKIIFILEKTFTPSGIMITVTFFPISSTLECLHYKNIVHILIFSHNST